MKELGLEILNKIYESGYDAYIVGGFPRDMLLNIESNDIDITTNATPKELTEIFNDLIITSDSYGAVKLNYKNNFFDITTFRQDDEYLDNRHPSKVIYVNDLKEDLLRRDFTINTICIDKNGDVIDLLNAKKDLDKKIIQTVIDSNKSFSLDALRILRAVRFASYLDFNLSKEVVEAIEKNKYLLKKLSYEKRKEELDKIFGSNKAYEGIMLIKKLGLDKVLELDFDRVKDYSDIVGIWSMINPDNYRFTSSEKELIKKVNIVYKLDNLDSFTLYQYGLYVNLLAGLNKNISKNDITIKYESLPIKNRDDILIKPMEICDILKRKPGSFIGKIYHELERLILEGKIQNNRSEIAEYIKNRGED